MTDKEYLEKYIEPSKVKDGLKRLEKGEPVQYIIGNVNFYGYKINVDRNVLIPRFETEELTCNAIKYIKDNFTNPSILEVGTGSGCISIALKKELKTCDITATDISKKALKIAKKNAIENNAQIKFVCTNIYDNINEKFDCLISNPPYISKDEKIMDIVYNNEPYEALFAENNGLYFYEEILKNAYKILKDKFIICFEIGMTQADEIKKIANKYLNNINIIVKKDMQQRDRMIFIKNFE